MIPVEAVEAAAKRMSAADRDILDWELYKDSARGILETAAPHIRAQAFEEAARKLRSDMDVPQRIWVANKVRALAMIERGDG